MTALADWFHMVVDVGDRGLSRTRQATPDELIELARELDVLSFESLTVSYTVKPIADRRYEFSGTFDATLTQACVVSLEPLPARLQETFSVTLGPAELITEDDTEEERLVSSVPDIESIENGRIEAGNIVFSVVSAAIEPYPRKEGVEFGWVDPKSEADAAAGGAFAALAALKRDT